MTETVQRGWVYDDNGIIVYRASSLYSCLRSMVAARLGETALGPHANLRAAMDASSGLESELLKRTAAQLKGELIWEQREVELKLGISIDGETNTDNQVVIVRGHIDALYRDGDEIIEAKTLGDTLFEKYIDGGLDNMGTLGTKYKWQGAVYGYATGRKVRFAIGHKVKVTERTGPGGLDTPPNEITGWAIDEVDVSQPYAPEDLVPLATIIDRIRTIEEHASRDELPDCDMGCREGDPYSEVHLLNSPEQGDDDLLVKLIRYNELKEILGDADKGTGLLGELEDIKEYVKQEYGDARETRKVTVGPFTASIVPQKGREYIDRKWLQKNHPDIADAATRIGSPFMQLIVKKAQSNDG